MSDLVQLLVRFLTEQIDNTGTLLVVKNTHPKQSFAVRSVERAAIGSRILFFPFTIDNNDHTIRIRAVRTTIGLFRDRDKSIPHDNGDPPSDSCYEDNNDFWTPSLIISLHDPESFTQTANWIVHYSYEWIVNSNLC